MELRDTWPNGRPTRSVTVAQGEFKIASRDDEVLFTVLGSCVSVCLYDPAMAIGGMNHYLLATDATGGGSSMRYGVNAMELLINGLLRKGASRSGLRAKVYGGAQMSDRFKAIGRSNIDFALKFFADEGFRVEARDVGGTQARKLVFHPVSGQAKCTITRETAPAVTRPIASPPPRREKPAVTLF